MQRIKFEQLTKKTYPDQNYFKTDTAFYYE